MLVKLYLRSQRLVLLLQLFQLVLQMLQLAECGGGGSPQQLRWLLGGRHAGVLLTLLRGTGHYPEEFILLS